eukprot:XP_011671127.1 PREDICTED: uncharacterized protein LOC105441581 isoform X3 [Strongylocentrotus purpuratus]
MASPTNKQTKRRGNYSDCQIEHLCRFVQGKCAILFGKAGNCSERVQERKKRAWEEAAITMAAIGCPNRSGKDLRLLWNDLRSKAKKYRDSRNKTGGGAFDFNPRHEMVLSAMTRQVKEGILPQSSETGASTLPLSQNAGAVELLQSMGEEAGAVEEEVEGDEVEMVEEREPRRGKMKTKFGGKKTVKKSNGVSYEEYQERLLQVEQEKLEVMKKNHELLKNNHDLMKSMLTVM